MNLDIGPKLAPRAKLMELEAIAEMNKASGDPGIISLAGGNWRAVGSGQMSLYRQAGSGRRRIGRKHHPKAQVPVAVFREAPNTKGGSESLF